MKSPLFSVIENTYEITRFQVTPSVLNNQKMIIKKKLMPNDNNFAPHIWYTYYKLKLFPNFSAIRTGTPTYDEYTNDKLFPDRVPI